MGFVSFEILVDGKQLMDSFPVLSIEINRAVYGIPGSIISILLPLRDVEDKTFEASAGDAFVPGAKVEIKLGYERQADTVFKGTITRQAIRGGGEKTKLIIYCEDEAANGWDHTATDRARAEGLLLYAASGGVVTKPPFLDGASDLEVSYGRDVFEFDADIDTDLGRVSGKHLPHARFFALRGSVTFYGNARPKLNTTLKLNGFGSRFNGSALITSIHHIVEEGKWTTTTGFGLEPIVAAPPVTAVPQPDVEITETNKVITVTTQGGNSIVLSDEAKSIVVTDQHGNTVSMESGEITVKSKQDIVLDAGGSITLKAAQEIDVSASGGDVSLEGLNVNARGKAGVKLKGGATAELSAGGQTTVKGAMVMIN